MGDTSLIRTALLIALIAAFGFVAAGQAPAAESAAGACESAPGSTPSYGSPTISFPPP
jgi:hypothetical protein